MLLNRFMTAKGRIWSLSELPNYLGSSRLEFGVEIGFKLVLDFRSRLSESRISLGAHFDFKFCLSQSRASLEAYFDFKLHLSQLRTSLRRLLWLQTCLPKSETFHKPAWTSNSAFKRVMYIDVKFHLSASRTSLEAHFKFCLSRLTTGLGAFLIPNFIFHSQELVYKPTLTSNCSFQSQRLH